MGKCQSSESDEIVDAAGDASYSLPAYSPPAYSDAMLDEYNIEPQLYEKIDDPLPPPPIIPEPIEPSVEQPERGLSLKERMRRAKERLGVNNDDLNMHGIQKYDLVQNDTAPEKHVNLLIFDKKRRREVMQTYEEYQNRKIYDRDRNEPESRHRNFLSEEWNDICKSQYLLGLQNHILHLDVGKLNSKKDIKGWNLLHHAAANCWAEGVGLLLKNRADVNCLTTSGSNPGHLLFDYNRPKRKENLFGEIQVSRRMEYILETIELLLQSGLDTTKFDRRTGKTILMMLVEGYPDNLESCILCLRLLLKCDLLLPIPSSLARRARIEPLEVPRLIQQKCDMEYLEGLAKSLKKLEMYRIICEARKHYRDKWNAALDKYSTGPLISKSSGALILWCSVSDNALQRRYIFVVKNCGERDFNGKYVLDINKNNGLFNGKPCYRKHGVSPNGTVHAMCWENEQWSLRKDYLKPWYIASGNFDFPPTSGWSCKESHLTGRGTPPQIVYLLF